MVHDTLALVVQDNLVLVVQDNPVLVVQDTLAPLVQDTLALVVQDRVKVMDMAKKNINTGPQRREELQLGCMVTRTTLDNHLQGDLTQDTHRLVTQYPDQCVVGLLHTSFDHELLLGSMVTDLEARLLHEAMRLDHAEKRPEVLIEGHHHVVSGLGLHVHPPRPDRNKTTIGEVTPLPQPLPSQPGQDQQGCPLQLVRCPAVVKCDHPAPLRLAHDRPVPLHLAHDRPALKHLAHDRPALMRLFPVDLVLMDLVHVRLLQGSCLLDGTPHPPILQVPHLHLHPLDQDLKKLSCNEIYSLPKVISQSAYFIKTLTPD